MNKQRKSLATRKISAQNIILEVLDDNVNNLTVKLAFKIQQLLQCSYYFNNF